MTKGISYTQVRIMKALVDRGGARGVDLASSYGGRSVYNSLNGLASRGYVTPVRLGARSHDGVRYEPTQKARTFVNKNLRNIE